jgi:hypothetical protein
MHLSQQFVVDAQRLADAFCSQVANLVAALYATSIKSEQQQQILTKRMTLEIKQKLVKTKTLKNQTLLILEYLQQVCVLPPFSSMLRVTSDDIAFAQLGVSYAVVAAGVWY